MAMNVSRSTNSGSDGGCYAMIGDGNNDNDINGDVNGGSDG